MVAVQKSDVSQPPGEAALAARASKRRGGSRDEVASWKHDVAHDGPQEGRSVPRVSHHGFEPGPRPDRVLDDTERASGLGHAVTAHHNAAHARLPVAGGAGAVAVVVAQTRGRRGAAQQQRHDD